MYKEYRYDIEFTYIYKNKEKVFDITNIKSLMIDYDYDNKNMPVMLIKISIDKNIIDDMIEHCNDKEVILNVYKFDNSSTTKLKEVYISDSFMYFMSKETNDNKVLDYSDFTEDSEDIFKTITIGLVKKELLTNNKRIINEVFHNTSLVNILVKNMQHMKLLIEPLHNNKYIDSIIIPPTNSITNYIKYIDNIHSLYNTKYRLFYDFDMTYLLSSSGNIVKSNKDHIYTFIININNTVEEISKSQGVRKENDTFIIDMDAVDVTTYEEDNTEKSYTTILGVDVNGNVIETPIKNQNLSDSVRIERYVDGNSKAIDNLKSEINNKSLYLTLIKTELDASAITINKQYIVKNLDKLDYNDGQFILASKKELYIPDNDNYILTSILTLRQIYPSK